MLGISILSEMTRLITLFGWLIITPMEMVITMNPPYALRIVRGADTHYLMQKYFYKKTIKA